MIKTITQWTGQLQKLKIHWDCNRKLANFLTVLLLIMVICNTEILFHLRCNLLIHKKKMETDLTGNNCLFFHWEQQLLLNHKQQFLRKRLSFFFNSISHYSGKRLLSVSNQKKSLKPSTQMVKTQNKMMFVCMYFYLSLVK